MPLLAGLAPVFLFLLYPLLLYPLRWSTWYQRQSLYGFSSALLQDMEPGSESEQNSKTREPAPFTPLFDTETG